MLTTARALLATLLLTSSAWAAAPVGELRKIECRDETKIEVEASTGDLLQISVFGGTYPGGMYENLKVVVNGTSVQKVAVVFVPQVSPEGEPLIGGLEIAAFLTYKGPGTATIKVTPTGNQVSPKTYEIVVKELLR